MTPRRHLFFLRRSATRKIDRLRRIVTTATRQTPSRDRDYLISYVVIETQNAWSNFARAYYLSAFMSSKRCQGGTMTVPTPPCTIADAIAYASVFARGGPPLAPGVTVHRRNEPNWHDPNILLRLASHLSISNQLDIAASVSIGTRVFIDLPVFRNFFAHRNRFSEMAAKRLASYYSVAATKSPQEIVLSVPAGGHQAVLHQWLDDIQVIVELLCD